jgi:Domain of unknown function (DUF4150)/GHH signature containing HNH/Endo VII superfamily nuclease toxin  2
MQTHVYANDQEIACKAVGSDGTSPQAFPDPCWSPPAPSAGPVVIPYPNTCFADSITNGTNTVFIAGKEVAIEDKSYFATSIGNEPATQAFGKGVATGVITGKAYFTQWSFDVIFEGYGVPRHEDLVSHNHGSMPSNTPIFPYLSRGWTSNDCSKEEARIKRACKKEDDHSDSKKAIRSQSKLRKMLRPKPKASNGKNWHWTDDHCDGLDIALGSKSTALDYAKKMEDVFKHLPEELNILGALKSELQDMAINAAGKAAAKLAIKAGLKQAAGSVVPVAGNVVMALWTAVDAAIAIGDVNEIREVATESLEQLDVLQSKLGELQSMAKEFENFSNLSPEEQLEKAQKAGAAGQDVLATLNECTRARKCMLVPYGPDAAQRGREHSNNKGCCNGQTGHHLIYDGMMKNAGCVGYDYKDAPTVCTEGTNQNVGSHGRIHTKMDEQVQGLADAGKAAGGKMSMDDTIDAAVKSHKEAFPASRCSADCIRNQLNSYYKGKCPNASPSAVDKNGKETIPRRGDTRTR